MSAATWVLLAAAVLLAPTPTPSARARRPIRERLPRFGSQPVPSDPGLALALDLTAAALRAGQPLSAALQLGAPAAQAHSSELARVGRLLELGAAPHTAWQSLDRTPALAQLATSARRSADSGVRLADAFGRLAAELRADARAVAEGRAHRAGVWAMAPLGFCFLPAFVCLGIVPTIAGIAGQILR